jgi:hypothetical protein
MSLRISFFQLDPRGVDPPEAELAPCSHGIEEQEMPERASCTQLAVGMMSMTQGA